METHQAVVPHGHLAQVAQVDLSTRIILLLAQIVFSLLSLQMAVAQYRTPQQVVRVVQVVVQLLLAVQLFFMQVVQELQIKVTQVETMELQIARLMVQAAAVAQVQLVRTDQAQSMAQVAQV